MFQVFFRNTAIPVYESHTLFIIEWEFYWSHWYRLLESLLRTNCRGDKVRIPMSCAIGFIWVNRNCTVSVSSSTLQRVLRSCGFQKLMHPRRKVARIRFRPELHYIFHDSCSTYFYVNVFVRWDRASFAPGKSKVRGCVNSRMSRYLGGRGNSWSVWHLRFDSIQRSGTLHLPLQMRLCYH